jgi:hypothetical protein
LGKTFLPYIAGLVAFISLNTVANLSINYPVAWNAFLVVQLVAFLAWCKFKLDSRSTCELFTTPNFIFTDACVFLASCFLAILFLLYILQPFLVLIWSCSPLIVLFNKIPHSSDYCRKAVQWFAAISSRLREIFLPPQQAEAAPQNI